MAESVLVSPESAGVWRGAHEWVPAADLWQPIGPLELADAGAGADAPTVAAIDDRRPRWITYGSSITQAGEADGRV